MTRATSTREQLLDAAASAVVAGDWGSTPMADVARSAGVSRQTLYYEFGSRDGLAEALALREAERYADGAAAARDGDAATPAELVRAGVEFTLREAAGNPLLKAVLTDQHADLLPLLTTRAESLHAAATERCAHDLLERWPDLPADDVRLVADAVTRLTVSHLVLPGARPEQVAADVARLVERLLPVTKEPLL